MPSTRPELGWVLTARTVSDREVATELTRTYLQRVLAVNTHPGSPLDKLSGTAVGTLQIQRVANDSIAICKALNSDLFYIQPQLSLRALIAA